MPLLTATPKPINTAVAASYLAALGTAIGGNDEAQSVTQFIDTGNPELNKIISGKYDGGLPYGRMVEMFGESSTGKTALATEWMANAQALGGVAGFSDWERSFSVDLARDGYGLNTDPLQWVYKRPRTWEEGNMFAAKACQLIREKKLIDPEAPILWVFDSIAAALPKSQAEKTIDEYTMNDTTALARVTSTTLKAMAQYAADFNACFLYLNQIRLKPGVVYGDPRTTPGGKAMEYYATNRLALGKSKIMEGSGSDKEFVGQQITIQCVKSKLTKPFQECEMRLDFDEAGLARFNVTLSLVESALKQKKLNEPSKGWVEWIDGTKHRKKALAEFIDTNGLQVELAKLLGYL